MNIGQRIRKARLEAGLSQPKLAALVGCAVQTIVAWEKEVNAPLGVYREKLEKVLGVSLKEEQDEGSKQTPASPR